MPEDFENEDELEDSEEIEQEEDLILEESPKRKQDALIELITSQIYFIQQIQGFPDDLDIERAKASASCFQVIDAAQNRLLDKIKDM